MPPRPGAPAPLAHAELPIPRVHVLGEGASDRARALVRTGEWARVRPGAFVEVASLDADPYVRERQLLLGRIVAVVAQSGPTTVVSHASAAAVWGLPLDRLPQRVEVLKPVRRAGNAASDVVRRVRSAHDLDAEQIRGLPVTSMTRTAVDCALTLGGRGGLVVADAALAAGVSRTACQALLARSSGARGIRAAREVIACADAGAESAGETRARWTVLVAGRGAPPQPVGDSRSGRSGWPTRCVPARTD